MGLGIVWMIGLDWILFDRLGFVLNGRVCHVFSFMRYRYACEVDGSFGGHGTQNERRDLVLLAWELLLLSG